MFRFALRPRWILSHLFVLALVATMISAGFWQLRRLDEKRDRNETITARSEQPVVDLATLSSPVVDDAGAEGEGLAFRRVSVSGTYRDEDTVLWRGRSMGGTPGFVVFTPLETEPGVGVAVARGWVAAGRETDGSDLVLPDPPDPATVVGLLQEEASSGAKPSGDQRTTIGHVDLDWYDEHSALDLYPVWLQLEPEFSTVGTEPTALVPLEPPDLTEGPHLSYAGQWFIFTTIAVVGYPWILLRLAREKRGDVDA